MIIQANAFSELPAVTVLPITGTLVEAPLVRVLVEPTPGNGLIKPSQIMVDKPQTPLRAKIGPAFGRLGDAAMVTVNRALAVFLGLA